MRRSSVAAVILAAAAAAAAASPAAADRPSDASRAELIERGEPAPRVEVLTMGPGSRFVERFGHAALCLRWPDRPKLDVCYNYGTTDFTRPWSLAWGFVRGDAAFWVEAWPRWQMLDYYVQRDRSVWVQTLDASNSSAAARVAIARKLEYDARFENREYVYHHFADNCTTRVRDVVDRALDGALRAGARGQLGPTFRQLGVAGLAEHTWFVAGTDFAVGRSADARPSAWQAMFLPRELRRAIADTLGIEAVPVYVRRGPPPSGEPGPGPRLWTLLFAALLALPAALSRALGRRERLGLALSSIPLGLIGLALWLGAAMSSLPELRWNEALLVFVPTDLALPWLGPRRRVRYARTRVVMLLAVSVLAAVGPLVQPLWLPILVALPTLAIAGTGSPGSTS